MFHDDRTGKEALGDEELLEGRGQGKGDPLAIGDDVGLGMGRVHQVLDTARLQGAAAFGDLGTFQQGRQRGSGAEDRIDSRAGFEENCSGLERNPYSCAKHHPHSPVQSAGMT